MSIQEEGMGGLHAVSYYNMKRQDLLHLLARFASYLEDQIEQTNRVTFPGYIDRNKGSRTFDIEHVIAFDFPTRRSASSSMSAIQYHRDELGALILLPRGRNRSLQDANYEKKLPKYATENVLAQTLTQQFYENNPTVKAFIDHNNAPLTPIELFDEGPLSNAFNFIGGSPKEFGTWTC